MACCLRTERANKLNPVQMMMKEARYLAEDNLMTQHVGAAAPDFLGGVSLSLPSPRRTRQTMA
jgi:hypothetical protein